MKLTLSVAVLTTLPQILPNLDDFRLLVLYHELDDIDRGPVHWFPPIFFWPTGPLPIPSGRLRRILSSVMVWSFVINSVMVPWISFPSIFFWPRPVSGDVSASVPVLWPIRIASSTGGRSQGTLFPARPSLIVLRHFSPLQLLNSISGRLVEIDSHVSVNYTELQRYDLQSLRTLGSVQWVPLAVPTKEDQSLDHTTKYKASLPRQIRSDWNREGGESVMHTDPNSNVCVFVTWVVLFVLSFYS